MIVFLIDAFEKVYFEKKSADDNEVLNSLSVQRVIASWLLEIIHVSTCVFVEKRMPDSNKYIYVYTKSRIKTNKLANNKKKEKKEMLLDSNPHLLSTNDSLLSIRLSRNCDFFMHKIIVPQSKAYILRRFPTIGRKVIEYSYVSGQC